MDVRSVAFNVVRIVVVLAAFAVLLVNPVVIERPSGRSYEPLGLAVDAVALIVLVAVAWSVLRRVQKVW